MKKLKVLLFIDSLGNGGAEQMLVSLVPALMKQNIEFEIVTITGSEALVKEFEKIGVRVNRLRLSHRWNLFSAYFRLKKIIAHDEFQIFHGHLFFGALYARIAAILAHQNTFVVSLHSLEFQRDLPDSWWHFLRLKIRKMILKSAKKISAISQAVKMDAEKVLLRSDIEVIANPVSIEGNLPPIQEINLNASEIIFAVPARLIPEKGHETILQAIPILIEKYKLKPQFYLWGSGPLKKSLSEKIAAQSLSANVFLKGTLAHEELMQAIAETTFLVLPSLSEGFGLAAAEGMLLGKIVIASRTGGLADLIEHGKNGLLFTPGSAEDLAEQIFGAANGSQDLNKIQIEARISILERFQIDLIARSWRKLYEGMLD